MRNMNLLENVALPLTLRGVSTSERMHAAKQQLKALGLLYVAHAYPERISTYEAQLASIARALIAQPKVLLLDEITTGLSEKEGFQILGIIHDIGKLRELVVISFSGTKDCIVQWDRFFTLDHGRIQEEIL